MAEWPGAERSGPIVFALRGLLLLASLYTLALGKPVFFPIVLALLFNVLLREPVLLLRRWHVPKVLGAALVLGALLAAIGFAAAKVRQPALTWLGDAPQMLERVERRLGGLRRPMEEATRAAERVEELTTGENREDAPRVERERPSLAQTALTAIPRALGGVVVTVVLLYLLLVFDEALLRQLVIALPGFRSKRRTLIIARAMERHVTRYLMTVTVINLGLGVAVGTALHLVGIPSPWLWGTMAGLLNFVPYLGGVVGVTIVALVALVSLDDLGRALAAPLAYVILNVSEGMVLTPIILGRRFSLNPVVIFVWLLLWGWLWGIGGALIAVPLLTTFKILCDHVPMLHRVGRALER
jgi:predicted PurR-regulated permease PerM